MTTLIKRKLLLFIILVLAACSRDEDMNTPFLTSPAAVTYDASCQTDTISFNTTGSWKAMTDAEWLTLMQDGGNGNGRLPIYIQQNDDEKLRTATITIITHNGQKIQVSLMQRVPSENGLAYIDLPKTFGLGWGYDMKADIADVTGLRGQVFDAAALCNDYGDDIIQTDNNSYTDLYFASGNSHEEMQTNMGAKFAGSVDLFIAGAKVETEYSDQIKETRDRRYVWCRDFKAVKVSYFANLDYGEYNLARYCTTSAFRNAVRLSSPQDFVSKFGTHVIITSFLGGKFDYYFTVDQKVKTEVERIVTHINVKILFIKKSWTEVEESTWTEIQRDFKARYQVTGGGKLGIELNEKLRLCGEKNIPLEDPTLFTRWENCFTSPQKAKPDDLTVVDMQVIPIWDIVKIINPNKAAAIEQYVTTEYLKNKKL